MSLSDRPADPNPEAEPDRVREAALFEVDPQRSIRRRARFSSALFLARGEADFLALAQLGRLGLNLIARPGLLPLALALLRAYPPGRAHRWARELGEAPFGETPLVTAMAILREAGVSAGQRLVELGCGTGRLSLIAAHRFGLECEAIDHLEPFVRTGNQLASRLGLGVRYRRGDLSRWTGTSADWVYLSVLGASPQLRGHLTAVLGGSSSTVICVGEALRLPGHRAELLGRYFMSWGRSRVFVLRPVAPVVDRA